METLTAKPPRTAYRYDPASYGDHCAEFYDEIYRQPPRQMIATLASLAAGGPVLELGIATGRVAIQLAQLGLAVTGVENSSAMLRVLLRKKLPGSMKIVSGDFTTVGLSETFPLVICIHSTILLLPRKAQRQCFANVAKHLSPAGIFLLEAVPEPPGRVSPPTRWRAITRRYRVETTTGARDYCVTQYHTPAEELDKMARDAGLALAQRWSDWRRTPLVGSSPNHISMYVRASA